MSPAIISTVFAIVKGLVGLNTRDSFEKSTGTDRPAVLARRSIGTGIMVLSGIAAALMGVQIPEADTVALTGNLTQAYDAVMGALPAITGAWGSIVTVIGFFKRKKKG